MPRLRPCIICSVKTPFALNPRDHGRRGKVWGLCGEHFNNNYTLALAVAFARATWRKL